MYCNCMYPGHFFLKTINSQCDIFRPSSKLNMNRIFCYKKSSMQTNENNMYNYDCMYVSKQCNYITNYDHCTYCSLKKREIMCFVVLNGKEICIYYLCIAFRYLNLKAKTKSLLLFSKVHINLPLSLPHYHLKAKLRTFLPHLSKNQIQTVICTLNLGLNFNLKILDNI